MAGNTVVVGTYTLDLIAPGLDKVAGQGEVVFMEKPVEMRPGGHAVNVSIDLAQLGHRARIYSVGSIGNDYFGEVLVGALRRASVVPLVEVAGGASTAHNVILVVRGEDRRFHVHRGANSRLSAGHVLRALEDHEPSITYLSLGFSRDIDARSTDIVRAAGKTGLVFVDSSYTDEESARAVARVLGLPDIIHLNSEEAMLLTGSGDPREALMKLRGAAKLLTVVTSSEGAMGVIRGSKLLAQKSYRVRVVDPTGGGDAFCAGLIEYLNRVGWEPEDEDLVRAVAYAQAAGAAAVTGVGASTNVTREIVDSLMEEQGEEVVLSSELRKL